MLSIIICSRTSTINNNLSENLKTSVGCDYELIIIDNSENKYSIFEAYNLGIEMSVGEYLCFIHDDILFHTPDWGIIIHRIFREDQQIGLIGIAGAKIKTQMPSAWWDCNEKDRVTNIIQHHKDKEKKIDNYGFEKEQNVEVAVIDGVFMAMRKDNRIAFSTKLKGFHAYDLNLSFEIKKYGYTNIVTNEILLEHFSSGIINESWVKSSYNLHKLYKKQMLFFTNGTSVSKRHEIINAQRFINTCIQFRLKKIALLVWFQLYLLKPISTYHLKFWKIILKTR